MGREGDTGSAPGRGWNASWQTMHGTDRCAMAFRSRIFFRPSSTMHKHPRYSSFSRNIPDFRVFEWKGNARSWREIN